MPSVKRTAKRPAAGRRAPKAAPRTRSKPAKGLRCPDCDFVAKHPMGLGRHRSARHGTISQRQSRKQAAGGWLTRREAARRAGVHYNTIRHWEQTGRLRRSRRRGAGGTMVNAIDIERLMSRGGRGAPSGDADAARIQAFERRFNVLLDGLERLVSSSRGQSGRQGPGGSRRAASSRRGGR